MSSVIDRLRTKLRDAIGGLLKEQSALKKLHRDSRAALKRMSKKNPALKTRLSNARGYAVFPVIGEAALVAGGAYGTGEVFEGSGLIGYAGVIQATVGLQLGGDTFSKIIVFHTKKAVDRFKKGKLAFSANAGAALLKGSARKANDYEQDVSVLTFSRGGALIEASLGVQKFVFKSAALGRLKSTPTPRPRRTRPVLKF